MTGIGVSQAAWLMEDKTKFLADCLIRRAPQCIHLLLSHIQWCSRQNLPQTTTVYTVSLHSWPSRRPIMSWNQPASSSRGVRNFVCDGCDKGYQREGALNTHLKDCDAYKRLRQARLTGTLKQAGSHVVQALGRAAHRKRRRVESGNSMVQQASSVSQVRSLPFNRDIIS